jgi:hypothetical protein
LQESALKLRAYPVARTISDLKESEGCEEGEDECAKNLGLTTTEQPPVSMQQHTACTTRTSDSSVARPRRGSITLADLPKFLSRRNTLADLPKFHSRRNIEYGAMPSDSSDEKEGSPKGDRRGLGTSDSSVERPTRGSITLADLPKFLSRRNTLTDLPKFHSRRNTEYGAMPSDSSDKNEGSPKGDRRGLGISISRARVRRTSATLRECVRRNSTPTGMRPEASTLSQSFTETPSEFANEEEGEPGSPDSDETVESKIVSLDIEEGMPPSCSTAMGKSTSGRRDSIDAGLRRRSYDFQRPARNSGRSSDKE